MAALGLYCVMFVFLIPALHGLGTPGGIKEVDISSPDVTKLGTFAINEVNSYTENSGSEKKLIRFTKATEQIVAGKLTRLTGIFKVGPDNDEEECTFSILQQPWLNKTELKDVSCKSVKSKKVKRSGHIGGGTHDIHLSIFDDFIKKHNKIYANEKEYKKRYHIFRANLKKIKLLRDTEQGTGEYGVNWFADLSPNEFKQYLGLKKPSSVKPLVQAAIPDIKLPNEFDWRNYNVVTPVKNQEACGSCWAFSVTGNIEGQWALKKGELLSLSEQELVDCDTADNGCGGGYMTTAYDSIVRIGGLETEKDYPYDAEDEKCNFNPSEVKVKIAGGLNITSNETGMAQWLVKNGPMSVGLNANAMQFYMGGVSHPFKVLCNPQDLDHGVLIVGYGVHTSRVLKKTLPYWIVKNSWGPRWGELGYYKLYRGDGSCGINQMVSSAVVN